MPIQLVSYGGTTLSIEYNGQKAAEVIHFLFQHLPPSTHRQPKLSYRLVDQTTGVIQFYREEKELFVTKKIGSIAEFLLGEVCHQLAAHCQQGLLFHAAGLAWQGHGLILPGASGVGKSTLTTWLLSRGFDYLTDELIFVPFLSEIIDAFHRPLNLKITARSAIESIIDFTDQTILSSSHVDLVSPYQIRQKNHYSQPRLKLILFPQYRPSVSLDVQALTKAQGGLELMKALVNARNLSDHGFSETTRLARQAPAYKIQYSEFADIDSQIKALLTTQV